MRIAIMVIMVLVISGCSLLKPEIITIKEVQYIEKPVIHPPMPRPVNFHRGTPRVITKETILGEPDRAVFQCFEWNEGQELGISLNDLSSYITNLKAIVCSYRRELDEVACKEFLKTRTEND